MTKPINYDDYISIDLEDFELFIGVTSNAQAPNYQTPIGPIVVNKESRTVTIWPWANIKSIALPEKFIESVKTRQL